MAVNELLSFTYFEPLGLSYDWGVHQALCLVAFHLCKSCSLCEYNFNKYLSVRMLLDNLKTMCQSYKFTLTDDLAASTDNSFVNSKVGPLFGCNINQKKTMSCLTYCWGQILKWLDHICTFLHVPGLCANTKTLVPKIHFESFSFFLLHHQS